MSAIIIVRDAATCTGSRCSQTSVAVRIGVEELGEPEAVETLEYPVFLRPGELALLQHHPVDPVLRGRIGGQALHHGRHRDPPPRRRRHHPEVEGPGAFVLGQAVAEHVVVGMRVQPLGDLFVISRQSAVGTCATRIVGTGESRRTGRVHDLPEPQGPRIRVDGHQRVHQGGAGAGFPGDDSGATTASSATG
jgi:hypothetical protein